MIDKLLTTADRLPEIDWQGALRARTLTYGDVLPQLLAHHLRPPADFVQIEYPHPPLVGTADSFEVVTKFTPVCITQEVIDLSVDHRDPARDVALHIIHLRDAHVIAALKALGWTPPPEQAP